MTVEYLKFLKDKTAKDVVTNQGPAARSWYHEDIQNRKKLLITVGDSWTWGDHLGNIDWNKCFDDPVRLTQIFGRILSDQLDADWVNIAEPGCSNYWMLEQLQDIEPWLQNHAYDRAIVVVTLTEDLREATYTKRWPVKDAYSHFFHNNKKLKGFLVDVENLLLRNLEQLAQRLPTVEFYVSRAFTDTWPENHSKLLLSKTWCDVIQDRVGSDSYVKPVPFVAQMAIRPLIQNYLKPEYKQEFLDMTQLIDRRWRFLGQSDYNLKGSTYHPNPAGHVLWAEYLFETIG